jgi:transcriptional regulator with XRE-family HTH domain
MDGDALLRAIGERVRSARNAAGLTQSTLERNAEVRPALVSALERGEENATVEDLFSIARALGCTIGDLLPEG